MAAADSGGENRVGARTPGHVSWAVVVAASLVFQATLMALYLVPFHGDWSAFICADRDLVGAPPYEHVSVGFPRGGFDGQFYYALARDPWAFQPAALDQPSYRHSRLLYPVLGWLFSAGGNPALLVIVLPLINLVSIGVLTWLGCRLAHHFGRSPWWGLLLTLSLNPGLAAMRDLTDPLSTMTCVGLLVACVCRDRPRWVIAWGILAILAREQNLVLLVLVGLREVLHRRPRIALWYGVACLPWLGWVLYLHRAYGLWPVVPGNLDWPFRGMLWRWTHLSEPGGRLAGLVHVAGMSLLMIEAGISLGMLRQAGRFTCALALCGTALAILGGESIYYNGWSYNRVFPFIPLGIGLWAFETNRLWPLPLTGAAMVWPVLAVAQAWLR